jgi:hypothetical protein
MLDGEQRTMTRQPPLSFMGQITTLSKHVILPAILAAGIPAADGDETASRLERATSVMNKLLESAHGIPPEKLSAADCVTVIPGFKNGVG